MQGLAPQLQQTQLRTPAWQQRPSPPPPPVSPLLIAQQLRRCWLLSRGCHGRPCCSRRLLTWQGVRSHGGVCRCAWSQILMVKKALVLARVQHAFMVSLKAPSCWCSHCTGHGAAHNLVPTQCRAIAQGAAHLGRVGRLLTEHSHQLLLRGLHCARLVELMALQRRKWLIANPSSATKA